MGGSWSADGMPTCSYAAVPMPRCGTGSAKLPRRAKNSSRPRTIPRSIQTRRAFNPPPQRASKYSIRRRLRAIRPTAAKCSKESDHGLQPRQARLRQLILRCEKRALRTDDRCEIDNASFVLELRDPVRFGRLIVGDFALLLLLREIGDGAEGDIANGKCGDHGAAIGRDEFLPPPDRGVVLAL